MASETLEVETYGSKKAKELKRRLEGMSCRVKFTSVSENARKPIKMKLDCPSGVSDRVLETIKEPGMASKILPDHVSSQGFGWNLKKKRKI